VLVIGPTPIKSAELKFKDLLYKRDAIEQTSRLQKEWAADNKLPFVELFDTLQDSPAYLDSLVDGLHPGDRGAEEIYARVKPRLMPILES
jgi:lysophospholipase L1-like esterase